jgi:undecaprenyl-diphosphatase
MRTVTHLGDTWFVFGAELVAAVHLAWRRAWAALLSAAAAITMIFGASSGVRALVSRARPLDHLVPVAGFSFPSAHATGAATAALVLLMIYVPVVARRHKAWLVLAVVCWPIVVGISRVALVAHWPSDVLGGWLLALGLVPVTYLLAARVIALPGREARRQHVR